MKTLNNYITEWKVTTSTKSFIKLYNKFIYKLTTDAQIKIFDPDWPLFNDYKNKVYIDGEHVELDEYGNTVDEYIGGTNMCYEVEIKDIDGLENCLYMFYDCKQLFFVPFFNTSKVENMFSMFHGCSMLEEVTLFNTSKVNDMYCMFKDCKNLKVVPKFNTKNVETMKDMFWNCYKLKKLPLFDTSKVKDIKSMFYGCNNLSDETN